MEADVSTLEYHELSEMFPLMEGEEFDRLVRDIADNGLNEPIVLFEGKILDGRNRYRACVAAGIRPVCVNYAGPVETVGSFVLSANLHRRHLSKTELALRLIPLTCTQGEARSAFMQKKFATKRELAKALRAKGKSYQDIAESVGISLPSARTFCNDEPDTQSYRPSLKAMAKSAGISDNTMNAARRLITIAPDLANEVVKGERSVSSAVRETGDHVLNGYFHAHKEARLSLSRNVGQKAITLTKHLLRVIAGMGQICDARLLAGLEELQNVIGGVLSCRNAAPIPDASADALNPASEANV